VDVRSALIWPEIIGPVLFLFCPGEGWASWARIGEGKNFFCSRDSNPLSSVVTSRTTLSVVGFVHCSRVSYRTQDYTILFMTVQYVLRRSVYCIVARLRGRTAGETCFDIRHGLDFFFPFPKRPDQLWDPQRILFKWMPAAVSLVLKWPEREANYSSPSTKVNNVRLWRTR